MPESWMQGFISANGLRIHYTRTGSGGKPAILYLHGYTDNGLCWARLARDLQDRFDGILPDARGHGRSEGPVEDMSIERLAADAAALIRALALDRPILFGHSMGAMTALAVAADHPELVRAAVLEDPPFRASNPYALTPEDRAQMEKDGRAGLLFHDLPLAVRITEGRAQHPRWDESEILPWAESKGEYDPAIVPRRVAFRSYPWREALRRVQCPLLLLTGDPEQGAIVTPTVAEEAAQLNSRLQVAKIDGAGHCIHRDQYGEAMRVVGERLAGW